MNAHVPSLLHHRHRDDFPGLAGNWAYLDTAATAQKPQIVIDAIARAYGPDYATVHRGVYERSATMTLRFEEAREKVARFIGAPSPNEVVFLRGATEAINLIANSWGERLVAGDLPVQIACRALAHAPAQSRDSPCEALSMAALVPGLPRHVMHEGPGHSRVF